MYLPLKNIVKLQYICILKVIVFLFFETFAVFMLTFIQTFNKYIVIITIYLHISLEMIIQD